MTWWQALFLGVLQGVTEFLPISSSGHLVLAQHWLGFPEKTGSQGAALFFDGVLHLGTLASVLLYFWRQEVPAASSAAPAATPAPGIHDRSGRLLLLLALGTLPAVLAVAFLGKHIAASFEQPVPVAWNFIVLGGVLFLTDLLPAGTIGRSQLRWWQALVIGVAQASAAIFRGLSRSGMTLASALLVRCDRTWAVRFSFLLSIPASAGLGGFAVVRALLDPTASEWLTAEFLLMTVAAATTSGLVGYVTMRPLVRLVQRARLWYFAVYLWIVAVVTLATVS